MLAADNLTIRRGASDVVRGVSASLARGEITAIVGPNGAGKSSLLLALAGLLPAQPGQVTLEGRALGELAHRERARAIGYLPQTPDIAWDVAAEKLIALGRLPHGDEGSDAGRAAIEASIAALALEPLRSRPVSQLSGGERARVLLARVLAGAPRWVLADEPLAALDMAHQLSLIAHLKSCAKGGQGVVIVLHDLALARNHAARVLVLQQGRLVADGPPHTGLSEAVISKVWGVSARWLGEPGAEALAPAGLALR
jgi:iron complex transport system ATP-binding protein